METSSPKKDRTVLPQETRRSFPGPAQNGFSPLSNEQIGAEFSEQIVDLSAKQAGLIAHRTPAAAKKWKANANAPDCASLINSALGHDGVRRWLLWKIAGEQSRLMAPEVLTELVAVLLRAADAGDGAARRILTELHRA